MTEKSSSRSKSSSSLIGYIGLAAAVTGFCYFIVASNSPDSVSTPAFPASVSQYPDFQFSQSAEMPDSLASKPILHCTSIDLYGITKTTCE